MIVLLLNCGTSWCVNDSTFFYGGASDSVFISYDDLRIANSKMVELKYEKELNTTLYGIIYNDSIIIDEYEKVIKYNTDECNKNKKKLKRQRNIAAGSAVAVFIGLIISLLK